MKPSDRIFVAGARGLVGSAIVRRLERDGYDSILAPTRNEVDLADAQAVDAFFQEEKPQFVFMAAAKVGGIVANNTWPADFLRENLLVELSVIDAARKHSVDKLLFLGSSCIYPKFAQQPMKEEYLLTGELEPTNSAYAVAKIAGIEFCQACNKQFGTNFISAMPTNLYGPGDNFDLETSHVLPALIRKFHEAASNGSESVEIWGTGTPRREFLHVDDLADACVHLMQNHNGSDIVNVGFGTDVSIAELASLVAEIVGYEGSIDYDTSRPDGTPRKLLDVSRINALGWSASIELKDGIRQTYDWYRQQDLARAG